MDKRLLYQAVHEIRCLRKSNEALQAQVDVIRVFEAALGLRRENRGMAVDIAWLLEKEAEKISEASQANEPVVDD